MESEKVFMDSYNYLEELCKNNTTDSITIDYNKLDCKSKGELKDLIQRFVIRRKNEIGKVIFTAK